MLKITNHRYFRNFEQGFDGFGFWFFERVLNFINFTLHWFSNIVIIDYMLIPIFFISFVILNK